MRLHWLRCPLQSPTQPIAGEGQFVSVCLLLGRPGFKATCSHQAVDQMRPKYHPMLTLTYFQQLLVSLSLSFQNCLPLSTPSTFRQLASVAYRSLYRCTACLVKLLSHEVQSAQENSSTCTVHFNADMHLPRHTDCNILLLFSLSVPCID